MKRFYMVFILMINILKLSFSVNMNTTTFDQRIDTGGYREIILKNTTNEAVRYKFSVTPSEKEMDMSKWVTLYPKVMNIPPLEERILKIHAKSPEGAKVGEYSFNLIVKPLIVPTLQESTGEIVGSSTLGFVPVIKMLGYVGDQHFDKNIDFTNIKVTKVENEGIEISGTLENKANAGTHIGFKFVGSNEAILDGKWLGRLNKKEKRNIKFIINTFKNPQDLKKIIIYDSTNIINLSTKVLK